MKTAVRLPLTTNGVGVNVLMRSSYNLAGKPVRKRVLFTHKMTNSGVRAISELQARLLEGRTVMYIGKDQTFRRKFTVKNNDGTQEIYLGSIE